MTRVTCLTLKSRACWSIYTTWFTFQLFKFNQLLNFWLSLLNTALHCWYWNRAFLWKIVILIICDTILSHILFSDNVLRTNYDQTLLQKYTVSWEAKISWTQIFLLMMIYMTSSLLMPTERTFCFSLFDLYFNFLKRMRHFSTLSARNFPKLGFTKSLVDLTQHLSQNMQALSTILSVLQLHTNCTKILTI